MDMGIRFQNIQDMVEFAKMPKQEQIAQLKKECQDMDTVINNLRTKLQQLQHLNSLNNHTETEIKTQPVTTTSILEAQTDPVIDESNKSNKLSKAKVYLDQIYSIIHTNGYNFEQIAQVLPTRDSLHFYSIMNEIILDIQKQYSFYTAYFLELCSSQNGLSNEEIQNLSNTEELRDMLIDYRDEAKDLEQQADTENSISTIVPLFSQSGNNLLINDLKLFSKEQYPYILRLLHELEQENFRHSKQLSSSSDLSGYCEFRNLNHYIRILYKNLGNHQYVVLGLFYKNTDNIMGLLNSMKQRVDLFESQKNNIEHLLENGNEDFMKLVCQEYQELKRHLAEEDNYGQNVNGTAKRIQK